MAAHVGGEYLVIAIYAHVNRRASYHFVGDPDPRRDGRQRPYILPSDRFVVISNRLPSNWRMEVHESGELYFAPESWMRPGFWEELWEGGHNAANVDYERELSIMLADEDGTASG